MLEAVCQTYKESFESGLSNITQNICLLFVSFVIPQTCQSEIQIVSVTALPVHHDTETSVNEEVLNDTVVPLWKSELKKSQKEISSPPQPQRSDSAVPCGGPTTFPPQTGDSK